MFRLEGASTVVREVTPPVLTEVFALLTLLGDVAFLVVLLSVLYWLFDREQVGTVIAYALVGLTVTFLLKEAFALPRPPAPIRAVPVDAASHGFPSGHALSSTVVYGGLVLVWDRLNDARSAVSTLALIALVGFSRVVIGVHYLGDVLAGFAVGGLLLAGLWTAVGRRADLACLIAAVLSVPFVVISGANPDSLFAMGASVGGVLAFHAIEVESLPRPAGPVDFAVLTSVGLVVAGGLYWVGTTVSLAPIVVLASGALVASVVWAPAGLRWSPVTASRRSGAD